MMKVKKPEDVKVGDVFAEVAGPATTFYKVAKIERTKRPGWKWGVAETGKPTPQETSKGSIRINLAWIGSEHEPHPTVSQRMIAKPGKIDGLAGLFRRELEPTSIFNGIKIQVDSNTPAYLMLPNETITYVKKEEGLTETKRVKVKNRLTNDERLILQEAAIIRRRFSENFDRAPGLEKAKADLKDTIRKLREEGKKVQSLDPELSEMYFSDAETAETCLYFIEQGMFDVAHDCLMDQDTAARDEIPNSVWAFLRQKA